MNDGLGFGAILALDESSKPSAEEEDFTVLLDVG
jgi:hypothetical protein